MTPSHSLVLELQRLATDRSNDLTDLLRKALLVATKLRTDDFRQWINNELHGYGDSKVPAYRTAQADLRAKNPYHGLIPFVIQDQRLADLILNVDLRESIGMHVFRARKPRQQSRNAGGPVLTDRAFTVDVGTTVSS